MIERGVQASRGVILGLVVGLIVALGTADELVEWLAWIFASSAESVD